MFLSTANPTSVVLQKYERDAKIIIHKSILGMGNRLSPVEYRNMKFYSSVMDDVLAGVREAFLDEGVDEQVLQELKQMWETKVKASKAIDPPEIIEPQPPPLQITQPVQNDTKNNINQLKQTNGVPASSTQSSRAKPAVGATTPTTPSTAPPPLISTSILSNTQQQPQLVPVQPPLLSQAVPQPLANTLQDKMVPIQLTLPAAPGSQDNQSRVYNIQVPASALATDQLKRILTAQVISATMALPTNVASTLLQQHVTAALQSQASSTQTNPIVNNNSSAQLNGVQGVLLTDNSNNRQFSQVNQVPGNITQVDGTHSLSDDELDTSSAAVVPRKMEKNIVLQLDGIYDTSDDDEDDDDDDDLDDDDDDDDDDDEKDDKEEDNDAAENGVEEDPLNSGDDVSEGDNTDLFETENVVVCQYDKINRSRNKWKFYLKDGIMNLAGRDYIFQKANGDAEW